MEVKRKNSSLLYQERLWWVNFGKSLNFMTRKTRNPPDYGKIKEKSM